MVGVVAGADGICIPGIGFCAVALPPMVALSKASEAIVQRHLWLRFMSPQKRKALVTACGGCRMRELTMATGHGVQSIAM